MINFSEILWKSGGTRERESRASAVAMSNEIQVVSSGLQNAPVERVRLDPASRIALLTDSRSAGADRLRLLRVRLLELRQMAKLRSIVITSPVAGEGKSTIAMSLATTLAEQ